MKYNIIGVIAASVLLMSCNNKNNAGENKETFSSSLVNIYSTNNIEKQVFKIDNSIDNIVYGKSGTKVRIDKNTFIDETGEPVSGIVEFELKEVFTPLDRVFGNLTTTFKGKALETGGMIYLNAKSKERNLSIGNGKDILVGVPTDSILSGMSLFLGKEDSLNMKWEDPITLDSMKRVNEDTFEKIRNVYLYLVDGFRSRKGVPHELDSALQTMVWAGTGLRVQKDSILKLLGYTVHLLKSDSLQKWSDHFKQTKGQNTFMEDSKTQYIFSVKKLGWANIDRLLNDPRTNEVDLITTIENQKEFETVYVTMVTKNMYLPGYQKKDESFCFSHNDEEPQKLPIGETATILATAYKNNTPYFAIRKIKIAPKQNISFKLDKTTMGKLNAELSEKL